MYNILGQKSFPERTVRADTLHVILLKNKKKIIIYFHLLVSYISIESNCVLFKFTWTNIKVFLGFISHSKVFPSCHYPPAIYLACFSFTSLCSFLSLLSRMSWNCTRSGAGTPSLDVQKKRMKVTVMPRMWIHLGEALSIWLRFLKFIHLIKWV